MQSEYLPRHGKIDAKVELVTPMQAKQWIDENNLENNRSIIKARVDSYVRLIQAGQWMVAQPIVFDQNGKLLDGQHRLVAVYKSGRAVEFLVARGVDANAFWVIDTGAPRSATNIAKMHSTQVKGDHLACLRAMYLAPGTKSYTLSPLEAIKKTEALWEGISFACTGGTTGSKSAQLRVKSSVLNAVVARAYYHENHKRLEEFLWVVRTGFSNGRQDDAAVVLRSAYQAVRQGVYSIGTTRAELFILTQIALADFFLKKKTRTNRFLVPESPKNVWFIPEIDDPK